MGDRTTVYMHVLKEHKERAKSLLDVPEHCVWGDAYSNTVTLEFDEVNYADVTEQVGLLTDNGIPHTWDWGPGGSYEAGYGYVIFDENSNVVQHTWDITERGMDCAILLNYIEEGKQIEELKGLIEEHQAKHIVPDLTEEHARRGKIYTLKRIVTQ